MRSPRGANVLHNKQRGAQVSGLTVANILGLLSEDPYDAQLVDGLRQRLKSPETVGVNLVRL